MDAPLSHSCKHGLWLQCQCICCINEPASLGSTDGQGGEQMLSRRCGMDEHILEGFHFSYWLRRPADSTVLQGTTELEYSYICFCRYFVTPWRWLMECCKTWEDWFQLVRLTKVFHSSGLLASARSTGRSLICSTCYWSMSIRNNMHDMLWFLYCCQHIRLTKRACCARHESGRTHLQKYSRAKKILLF